MTTLFEPLANIVRENITQAGGSISFARFMELALYHPSGYYQSADFSLGAKGDFTTAPEISPLFARCFAHQYHQITEQTHDNAILELGAGTGVFAAEILNRLASMGQLPDHYLIYDISPPLRQKQRDYLLTHCPAYIERITWLDTLPTNFAGTIIANEVLDALPVHCFRVENNNIYERVVITNDSGFDWKNVSATGQILSAVSQLKNDYALSNGYQSEISLSLANFIQSLAKCLSRGVILLTDYGYGRAEYYHPERRHGTLTCFYQHRHHDNPFLLPGQQDITAHVDFTAVAEAAVTNGLEISGFTTQAAFLLANRLVAFAEQVEMQLSEIERFKLHQSIKTLTLPTEMGDIIKIMGLQKGCEVEMTGFSTLNRWRDL